MDDSDDDHERALVADIASRLLSDQAEDDHFIRAAKSELALVGKKMSDRAETVFPAFIRKVFDSLLKSSAEFKQVYDSSDGVSFVDSLVRIAGVDVGEMDPTTLFPAEQHVLTNIVRKANGIDRLAQLGNAFSMLIQLQQRKAQRSLVDELRAMFHNYTEYDTKLLSVISSSEPNTRECFSVASLAAHAFRAAKAKDYKCSPATVHGILDLYLLTCKAKEANLNVRPETLAYVTERGGDDTGRLDPNSLFHPDKTETTIEFARRVRKLRRRVIVAIG